MSLVWILWAYFNDLHLNADKFSLITVWGEIACLIGVNILGVLFNLNYPFSFLSGWLESLLSRNGLKYGSIL